MEHCEAANTGEDSTLPPDSFSESLSSRADAALVSSALHSIHSLSTCVIRGRPVPLAGPFQTAFKLRVSNRTGSFKPRSPIQVPRWPFWSSALELLSQQFTVKIRSQPSLNLLQAYHVPGTILSALYTMCHLIS